MKYIFLIKILLFSTYLHASESMRSCMLLPILDGKDNSFGYEVFIEVEKKLLKSSWCDFKKNTDITHTLGNYPKNLKEHLTNKEVLKTISTKAKAGSLIKVNLNPINAHFNISIEVIGENGEDLYFSEQIQLKSTDTYQIANAVVSWLDIYKSLIPYKSRVKKITGKQLEVELSKELNLFEGYEIIIERPIEKKHHPLRKETIFNLSKKIATAKITNATESLVIASVLTIEDSEEIKIGDWVRIMPSESRMAAVAKYLFGGIAFKAGLQKNFTDDKLSVPETNMASYAFDASFGLRLSRVLLGVNTDFGLIKQITKVSEVSNSNTQGKFLNANYLLGYDFGKIRLLTKFGNSFVGKYYQDQKNTLGEKVVFTDPETLALQVHLQTNASTSSNLTFWGLEYQTLTYKKIKQNEIESVLSKAMQFKTMSVSILYGFFF